MKFKNLLQESSITRLLSHNEKHDCGAITAFRGEYTKNENLKRNKSLLAKIGTAGYNAIRILGTYPEEGVTGKEVSFFVFDEKDNGNLERFLIRMGEEFEQESILFIPKGAFKNLPGSKKAVIIGTTEYPESWIKKGERKPYNMHHFGKTSPQYGSRVNGRPFYMSENFKIDENIRLCPQNGTTHLFVSDIAKKPWRDVELLEREMGYFSGSDLL